MKKTLKEYADMPYTRELVKFEDGWLVRIKELEGCISQGDTAAEALEMIEDALLAWLEVAIEEGDDIPLPESIQADNYSGKFALRMPRSLHADIIRQAAIEGVSVNQYIVAILSAGNQNFKLSKPKIIIPALKIKKQIGINQ